MAAQRVVVAVVGPVAAVVVERVAAVAGVIDRRRRSKFR